MKYTIGIDEVGRGALAGPVVVVAAMVMGGSPRNRPLGKLKDSKKLSAAQRERWYAYFASHPKIIFGVARVYPRQIEARNISQAANVAARRACARLISHGAADRNLKIFLDGGLYLTNRKWQSINFPTAKTVVRADEKIAAVKVASIVAKVHRDRLMRRLAKKYPAYGFEIHKGYGTKKHREALVKIGPSKVHRRTFIGSV